MSVDNDIQLKAGIELSEVFQKIDTLKQKLADVGRQEASGAAFDQMVRRAIALNEARVQGDTRLVSLHERSLELHRQEATFSRIQLETAKAIAAQYQGWVKSTAGVRANLEAMFSTQHAFGNIRGWGESNLGFWANSPNIGQPGFDALTQGMGARTVIEATRGRGRAGNVLGGNIPANFLQASSQQVAESEAVFSARGAGSLSSRLANRAAQDAALAGDDAARMSMLRSSIGAPRSYAATGVVRNMSVDANALALRQTFGARGILPSEAAAMNAMAGSARNAAAAVGEIGNQGKLSLRVLEAFFLYRGFVALEQGALRAVAAMADLQHQVALVQTQIAGGDRQGEITSNILRIGRETGANFSDLAKAEYQIVSANIAVADSYRVLDLSARAAIAGNTDIATAFNSALSQANAFGIGMDRLNEIYDKQFNLVRRGIFTYEQFAQVSGIVAEAFDNAGQSMETANAALAAVSLVFTGPQLNRGATALRNLALAVSNTPDKFAAMGVSVTDANGDFRDLIPILEGVKGRLEGMTEAQQAAALHTILPEKKEGQAIQALLGNLDALKRNYIEQKLALGDMDKAYKTVREDLVDQANILRNNLTTAVQNFAGPLGGIVTGINGLDRMMPGFTGSLLTAAAAMTALAVATQYLNSQSKTAISLEAARDIGLVAEANTAALAGESQIFLSKGRSTRMALGRMSSSNAVRFGLPAVSALAANMSGAGQEFSAGGLAGAAAQGAAFAIPSMNPWVIGGSAAASALAYGLGTAFHSEAPKTAASFSERFSVALKDNAGDVASAFTAAIEASAKDGGLESLSKIFTGFLPEGAVTPTGGPSVRQGQRLFTDEQFQAMRGAVSSGQSLTGNDGRTFTLEDLRRAELGSRIGHNDLSDVRAGPPGGPALIRAVDEANRRVAALGGFEGKSQFYGAAVSNVRSEAIDRMFKGAGIDDSLKALATMLSEAGLSGEKARQALDALSRGDYDSFLRLTSNAESASVALGGLLEATGTIKGDFGALTQVFTGMGDQGRRVAAIFKDLAGLENSLKVLQSINELGIAKDLGIDTGALGEQLVANWRRDLSALPANMGETLTDKLAYALTHPLDEAAKAIDGFTQRLNTNSLAVEEIQARAKLENRPLTAIEQGRINQLNYSNVLTRQQKDFFDSLDLGDDAQRDLNEALTTAAGATVDNTSAIERLIVAEVLRANADLANVDPTLVGAFADTIVGAMDHALSPVSAAGRGIAAGMHSGVGGTLIGAGGAADAALAAISGGAIHAAGGYSGKVDGPQLFLAGEAGPEWVDIAPMTKKVHGQRMLTGKMRMALLGAGLDPDSIAAMSQAGTANRLFLSGLAGANRIGPGAVDLDSLRNFDRVSGGSLGGGLERKLFETLTALLKVSKESARRGGTNLYFNGPTVPSELDLSIKQLQRMGPAMVRMASRSR